MPIRNVNFRLEDELLHLLDQLAADEGTNRTAVIRRLVKQEARLNGYEVVSKAVTSKTKRPLILNQN